MRRVLIWVGRFLALMVCGVALIWAVSLIIDMIGEHRIRAIAERVPSAYVKEQSGTLVLDHVRIIDGTGAAAAEDQSVVIEAGKISYAGPRTKQPLIQGAKVLDLSGRTVLPGLVGMHEHLFMPAPNPSQKHLLIEQGTLFPLMYLAAGVTTIRTAGSIAPERDLAVKQGIDQGTAVGPDMFLTAPYLEGEPATFPEMHSLANADEARRSVDKWADRGMTSFKAYTNITADELQDAVKAAHSHRLKITGHLCSVGFRGAADLGIDNLEHGVLTDTEFYSKKRANVCPDFRFYLSEYNTRLVIDSTAVQDVIRYLISHHVAITSTLAVIESEFSTSRPKEDLQRASDAMTWKAWRAARQRVEMVPHSRVDHLLAKEMEFERDFVKMGGTLLAGCDPTGDGSTLAGFGDQREVELLTDAGCIRIGDDSNREAFNESC